MGRGRRPNLALEPTRALQTQRAFRQRKAEHLANLEESVKILSDENAKLRKLLQLDARSAPASPHLKTSTSPPASSTYAPIAPAKGAPTPTSDEVETCDNCAPIQQANRQLSLAASQVEARVVELQQSIRALRSVLVHHGIPVPAVAAEWEADAGYRVKRFRSGEAVVGSYGEQPLPSGVQMTGNYFNSNAAGSPAAVHEYAASSRRGAPSSSSASAPPAGTGVWHTPSPSGILSSAPTPPSAYSPRHHHAYNSSYNSPAAATAAAAAAAAAEDTYRRPPPPALATRHSSSGSARPHLHPPSSMSPARQHAVPPPGSTYWSTASTASSSSTGAASPAALARSHALPAYASPGHGARRFAEDGQAQQAGVVGYEGVQSPRGRMVQRERAEGSEEMRFAREASRSREGSERKGGCCPAPASGSQTPGNGAGETKSSCCPPSNRAAATSDKGDAKWAAPPPLGVSFDMRASGPPDGHPLTTAVPVTAPVAAPVADADVELDGLKEDECCFGLVKCDSEGRIVI
ncbi:conserved hypothetical protein [Sporisorium reilianum SRZ2]|uniref:BZIP domain-containing protein n=1 Tax=Sporisorium reilianum (strain SRZ2) TaxID=999809 RepID=E6ZKP0_SPORE|nr:conserved hypothetical protein [Sporisorium reilianum SRZ2]